MSDRGRVLHPCVKNFTAALVRWEGKTTTLDIRPVIRASSGMLLKVFMPEFIARSTLELDISPEVSLNSRTEKSVAWDAYSGDLKFKN